MQNLMKIKKDFIESKIIYILIFEKFKLYSLYVIS